MPTDRMSHTVVHQNLKDVGFGVSQIYERVKKEGKDGADDEISVGHRRWVRGSGDRGEIVGGRGGGE